MRHLPEIVWFAFKCVNRFNRFNRFNRLNSLNRLNRLNHVNCLNRFHRFNRFNRLNRLNLSNPRSRHQQSTALTIRHAGKRLWQSERNQRAGRLA